MKTFLFSFVAALSLAVAPFPACGNEEPAAEIYVAPHGADTAEGTREQPLGTVQRAVERLSDSGGTIRLLAGVYREGVTIAPSKGTKTLTIEAAEGEKVIFDGGEDLSHWEAVNDAPGVYRSEAKEVINLWNPASRFRYLKELDEAGVRGWPGSFCTLEDGSILIQTPDQKAPGTLRRNATAVGFDVARSHTSLKGIQFKDYLGHKAATAVSVHDAADVEVADCTITNTVRGVSADKSSRDVRVRNCRITDVACGVHFSGIGLEVIDCVILAASRDFAIREEVDYDELNGIRFYHPAEKGTVRGCVTAGFWTGLYQKTSVGFDGAKPFVCEGNLFLDGVQSITGAQKGNRYRGNLIFGGVLNLTRPEGQNAVVQENYVFHLGKTKGREHGDGNRLGRHPFADLVAGDLQLRQDANLPAAASEAAARLADRGVEWTPEIAASLAARFAPQEAPSSLRFVGKPVCASSARGAVVSVRLNAPAKGALRFRAVGERGWQTVPGKENLLSSAKALAAMENVTDVEDGGEEAPYFSIVFPLVEGKLKPETEYEYEAELKPETGEVLKSTPARFRTHGGPKEIVARKGKTGLQEALDQALPGDTVVMEPGVYRFPAMLSHGGTADAPITIRGAGDGTTILDGGRRFQAMLELREVRHVAVRDLQVRLFERAGIVARDCADLTFKNCRFMNKAIAHTGYTKGNGILLMNSPRSTIEGCVFTRLLYGVQANDSPELTLTHNTSFKNLFSSALLRNSARDSRVTYNSFTFTGNISFYVIEKDPAAFQSLVCDYNNYATVIRTIGETAARAYAAAEVTLPEHMEQLPEPPERYGRIGGSKRIIDYIPGGERTRERFFSMDAWRKFSGKDAHSIYADPGYADPLRGDFRLLPGSPNVVENAVIGAAAVRQ